MGRKKMNKRRFRTISVMLVLSSLAAATPARAANICDIDPDTSWASWFAHEFGYCRGV
jgi:hypothetical protein